MLKKIRKTHIFILAIMMISTCILLYLTTQKEGMHLDEYLLYGNANHEEDGANKIKPEYGVRVLATDVFDPFFYADDFSLRNVYLNQTYNVHPPLYYLLMHIFTLVTHHFLALKTGILLNIIIHMINICLVWLIMKEMLSKEYVALFGTALYAFTPIVLGIVIFIRMYVLLATFILALTLLFIKEWENSDRKKFYVKLGLLSVGGTMTHYYFLIYLFFCCVIWGIDILKKHRWKELITFLVTMTVSGVMCVIIFPAMLRHIFEGDRGVETFGNITSLSIFKRNAEAFVNAINNVYGGFLFIVIIMAIALLLFKYVVGKQDDDTQTDIKRWTMIFVPCVLYFLVVTKLAVMVATRYISPTYGLAIILLMGLFDKVTAYITDRDQIKYFACVLLLAILLNNGYKIYPWTELYRDAKECIETARKYGANNECIYVMNVSWHSFTSYQEFIQYQNMTFIRDNNLDLLYNDNYSGYDHVVMYFDTFISEEEVDKILTKMIEMNPGLEGYEKLHKYLYNTAYYLD